MTYSIISFSGGKDSTAMLLHMMEIGEQIDEVINVDTGMEFPTMYDHIAKVRKVVEDAGIPFTVLRSNISFECYLLNMPPTEARQRKGYGWPAPHIRWCTKFLKTALIKRYEAKYSEVISCVGFAADEAVRRERKSNKNQRHPLIEWGWTEADCFRYCLDRGYDWGGLYDHFSRVSCWCCPLQSIASLRQLWTHYPDLWARLEELDTKIMDQTETRNNRPFKHNYRVADLSKRFDSEAKARREQRSLDVWGRSAQ